MPDHNAIYLHEADTYDRMVSRQQDIIPAIAAIRPYGGLDVADIGAGTGRLSVPIARQARSLVALDASGAMLRVAEAKLAALGLRNWRTEVSSHFPLPLASDSIDMVVSGWSLSYSVNAHVPDGLANLDQAISEMKRVLRSNGTIILIETLGTGCETPHVYEFLQPYYTALAEQYGFSHTWLRTDYTFKDAQEAEELTRFFFGEALAGQVADEQLTRVPECAGIWWLHI
ncbi:class I SAM-dependent methyltransferase [Xylanibacillus composti]|uniref:Methyltransferase type 11 domain-containing protein n=1 Tax=Xylanibacillus composti TaxID=1572762 RepID=A0A8J4H1E3_9BACL|nr:class I SAM-dependent methyltransferase [Xylanibacillus composti]MDT9723936.1 class I SAM-dependent methyltransferase [Xylanibacillus composti]GIQ67816.1 hypothetical protein XYCOK13_06400 [Xylanibacillus composti]